MKPKVPIKYWHSHHEHAGHFIGGANCKFHITTTVGDYYISTIGEYYPKLTNSLTSIGSFDCYYETVVFNGSKKRKCSCGCKSPIPTNYDEISLRRYITREQAQLGHRDVCFKYANLFDSSVYNTIFTDGSFEMPF